MHFPFPPLHLGLQQDPKTAQTNLLRLWPRVDSSDSGVPAAAFSDSKVVTSGKFFLDANGKWFVKGLTYGPFAPSAEGLFLPDRAKVRGDFRRIANLGANCIR